MQIQFNIKGVSAFGTQLPLETKIEETLWDSLPYDMKHVARIRQQEFLAGRFCAIQAARQIGYDLRQLPSAATREPLWPVGIKGSITHSKKLAISCVTADESLYSIGIDAEEIIKPGLSKEIEKTIATQDELNLINGWDEGVTLLFSAKESLYKALFPLVRTFIDFKEVVMVHLNRSEKTFVLELRSHKTKLLPHLGLYQGSFQKMGDTIVTIVSIPNKQEK